MADANEQGHEDLDSGAEGKIVPSRRYSPLDHAPVSAVADDTLFADIQTSSGPTAGNVSIRKLLRRKWAMLAVFVLVAGLGIPAVWKFVQPEYKSTATIHIAPKVQGPLATIEPGYGRYETYVKTQVGIITMPVVLDAVLDRDDVRKTSWYGEKPSVLIGDQPSDMERLTSILRVGPRRGTELIDVSVTVKRREDAKVLVDAVVLEYREIADGEYRKGQDNRIETLDKEIKRAIGDIALMRARKLDLVKEYAGALPTDVGAQMTAQVYELEAALRKVQMDLSVRKKEIDRRKEAIERLRSSEAAADPTTAPADPVMDPQSEPQQEGDAAEAGSSIRYAQDHLWSTRNDALNDARHLLELASHQGKGPDHPDVKTLQANLEYARNLLQTREKELDNGLALAPTVGAGVGVTDGRKSLAQLEYLQRGQLDREEVLVAEVDKLKADKGDMGGLAKELDQMNENLSSKREQLKAFSSRLESLKLEAKAPGLISIRSHGSPGRLDRDRRLMLTAMVLFAAFMASVGVGYLSAATDTSIHELSDVNYVTKAPFLGQLPFVRGGLGLTSDSEVDVALEESVRMVRTNLLQRLSSAHGSVVAITSAGPNEGKTSLAILLARSLQQAGKKVLLVDGDIRQPSLSRSLGAESHAGLVELLSGVCPHKDVLVSTRATGCHLLPAGLRRGARDSELLANGVFSKCIKKWKEVYDFVIMDSPPILSVADGRIIAGHADGSVMVLRASLSTRKDAVAAYAGLSAAGASLLGTVLVGTRDKSAYYAYQYYEDAGKTLAEPPSDEERS